MWTKYWSMCFGAGLSLKIIFMMNCAMAQSPAKVIKIGGLFDRNDLQIVAFESAVDQVNNDTGTELLSNVQLEKIVEYISTDEDINQLRIKVCKLLSEGVVSIFGPSTPFQATYVESVCDNMNIPCIQTHLSSRAHSHVINIHPYYLVLVEAYINIIETWKWDSFAIVYEDLDSLITIQEMILKLSPIAECHFVIQQMPENARDLLWEFKRTNRMQIFLYASAKAAHNFLTQAQQVGMLTDKNSYFLSSLDFQTLNLDDFKYSRANITGLRLMDPPNIDVEDILSRWSTYSGEDISAQSVPITASLMYDSVYMYAKALDALINAQELDDITPSDCNEDDSHPWPYGENMLQHLHTVNYEGMSGIVLLNSRNTRTNFQLEIIELVPNGLRRLASWESPHIFDPTFYNETIFEIITTIDEDEELSVANKTFIVTTILNDPFCMVKDYSTQLYGNDRYEGFVIDFLDHLAGNLSFKYIIQIVLDNHYGKDVNGTWNGMIGEVLDGTADMVVADITVNADRAQALDFTLPFMKLGISILFVNPQEALPSFFSFMAPFSSDVWLFMTVAYVAVSIIMFFIARISPYEWENTNPGAENPQLENQFGIWNSFWFTIGSLMQQGTELMPIAISTRMASSVWAFFILIMISSYTANLAAFLAIEQAISPFSSASELAHQDRIKYGVVESGSTRRFFENSSNPDYQVLWKTMKANPQESLLSNNEDGMKKVLEMDGEYAFFMESTVIEYRVERNCDLHEVGDSWLDSKGYAIGFPKGSKYRKLFNSMILDMQERGEVRRLKNKWWKENRKGYPCVDVIEPNTPLGIANLAGVFGVVVLGMAIAPFVALCEFFWVVRRKSKNEKVPFWPLAREELSFMMKCRGRGKASEEKGDGNGPSNNDARFELVQLDSTSNSIVV